MSTNPLKNNHPVHDLESLRLEGITTCVGFDDILDVSLTHNHPHLDHMIVVTSHEDKKTHAVARKHGATLVQTDLFTKNNRVFNKGAALQHGHSFFVYNGWRLNLDVDIMLPDNFRRILFNNTHLDKDCIYGALRTDVVGLEDLKDARKGLQHHDSYFISSNRKIGSTFVDNLNNYCPIGWFQLYHSSNQHPHPHSLGDAAHDDVLFASLWPHSQRRLLPTVICQHLITEDLPMGSNWNGRKSKRLN
jgi:hypothetical protein